MAVRSSHCSSSVPLQNPPPLPSLRRPSSSRAAATLSSSQLVPEVLRVAAPSGRPSREPLLGTPCHRGITACAGSSTSGGTPSPSPIRCNRIFVKGLPGSTSEGTLVKTFSQFGVVTRVKIITSKISKQSLGLAYVWFASEVDAQFAVNQMDGKFVDGRFIFVTVARPESLTRLIRATPYRF